MLKRNDDVYGTAAAARVYKPPSAPDLPDSPSSTRARSPAAVGFLAPLLLVRNWQMIRKMVCIIIALNNVIQNLTKEKNSSHFQQQKLTLRNIEFTNLYKICSSENFECVTLLLYIEVDLKLEVPISSEKKFKLNYNQIFNNI